MHNDTPSPLSPDFERAAQHLRELLAPWPRLAERVNGFHFDSEGRVYASWRYGDADYATSQAIAFDCREAGKWKRKSTGSYYHYVLTMPGLELTIPYAEPIPLVAESAEIQWDKLESPNAKPSGLRE